MQTGISIDLVVPSSQPGMNVATRHCLALPASMTIAQLPLWLLGQSNNEVQQLAGAFAGAAGFALFGRSVPSDTLLRDGDRLELLSPLLADPKLARRQRVQGRRSEQARKGQFDRWTRNR